MAKGLLDLHGYRGEHVEDAVDKFLMQLSKSNLKQARIMTGKGTGTVRTIVIRYLDLGGFHWAYEKLANGKPNEGVLVIFLD